MRWAIARHQEVIYRGSREECLAWAERYDLLCHTVPGRREPVGGRGFYPDDTEIPARLREGAVMMPEAMLPSRWSRRRAA